MGRSREPSISLLLYHLFKWSIVSPTLNLYLRGRVYGSENVPKSGSVIVVSNHASYFDPPLLSCAVGRPVAYMAKEELFNIPILGKAIKLYGAYPVSRGSSDRSAIRAALQSLENGWATGVFIEGSRTPDGKINEPKIGAALIAAKAQAPMLPVSLWGTQGVLIKGSAIPRPVPITVRIGQLIAPPTSTNRQELQAKTLECAEAIKILHDMGR